MWIKKFRLQRCWSQEQLAEISGLSVRTIQRLERGQAPSYESLKALAAVFEIDLTDLQEQTMTTTQARNQQDPEKTTGLSPWISREEERAIEYVEHVKGFYVHLLIFLVMISALFALNLLISPKVYWIVYVIIPWTLALGLQAALTFSIFKVFSPEWEKRQVEKRLGRKL